MCKVFFHPDERVDPVVIDQPLTPGGILPIAGGFEVIHAPGHCAGQVALLWRPGRMLFAGDVCINVMGLGDPIGFEGLEEGPCEPAQACESFIRGRRVRPWRAYRPRSVEAFAQ